MALKRKTRTKSTVDSARKKKVNGQKSIDEKDPHFINIIEPPGIKKKQI